MEAFNNFVTAANGVNTSFASLKHWVPNGIPIIVIHNNNPRKKYPIAAHNPININQIIFPIVFITFPSIYKLQL